MKDLKSFTLDPKAGKIVDRWPRGKKSGMVSDSIVKYQKWKEWYISKDRSQMPEDMRFYQIDELMDRFNNKCIENQALKQELAQIRQELEPKRSLIGRLFLSNDE